MTVSPNPTPGVAATPPAAATSGQTLDDAAGPGCPSSDRPGESARGEARGLAGITSTAEGSARIVTLTPLADRLLAAQALNDAWDERQRAHLKRFGWVFSRWR